MSSKSNVRFEISKGKFKDVHIKDVVKTIQNSDINVLGNYIFGFPNEDYKEMQQTLDLALELNNLACIFIHVKHYLVVLYTLKQNRGWKLPDSYEVTTH